MMNHALLLVHEPTSHWTAALERGLGPRRDWQVLWKPYAGDLLDACRNSDVRAVVMAASGDEQSLDLLREVRAAAPGAQILCLAEDDRPDWEWLARELGADAVLPDVVEESRIVSAVARLIKSNRSA
jgi:DNA-binding NarL/FixJ family response regulator